MYKLFLISSSVFLVILGSILGASLRFKIIDSLRLQSISSHWSVFLVNSLACFSAGLLLSIEQETYHNSYFVPLRLFLTIGFIGSFSTFSTFLAEIFQNLRNQKWKEGLIYLLASIFGGLFFGFAGYCLGNAR